VSTAPDLTVVELPALVADGILDETAVTAPASIWAVDVPRERRLTPVLLAALGVLAGIAAMVLGAVAVISASSSPEVSAPQAAAPVTDGATSVPSVERRVLALLAKPSTERVAFRGAPGLLLAVGSAGRAAILVRGLEPTVAGTPYVAWIVRPGATPVRAASFLGTEPAVFLARRLRPRASVVVSTGQPVTGPAVRNRVVALRG
jgi:outer membrane receptor protein involved in Fe transport